MTGTRPISIEAWSIPDGCDDGGDTWCLVAEAELTHR